MAITPKQLSPDVFTTDVAPLGGAPFSAKSRLVSDLLDPVNPQDAVTKAYEDARVGRSAMTSVVPTIGGKPAVQRVSPAGDLWLVCFGAGGTPSKPYRVECYSVATPGSPALISSTGTPTFTWFNVYQIRFGAPLNPTVMFATAGGPGPAGQIVSVNCAVPAAPVTIMGLSLGGGGANLPFDMDIEPSGTYAVIAQVGIGLRLVDVSVPAAMAIVSTAAGTTGCISVDASLWPFVVMGDSTLGTLRIIDYTVPAVPVAVGSVALSTSVRRVLVDTTTNIAYVQTNGTPNGLPTGGGQCIYVVDVSVPAAPVRIATIPFSNGSGADDLPLHLMTVAGKRILMSGCGSTTPGRIQTFDVTVPASPKPILMLDLAQNCFDATKIGDYLYVSNRQGAQELITVGAHALMDL
jgi:hypothetical protein